MLEKIGATVKVAWSERHELAEAVVRDVKKHSTRGQRYLLATLVVILLMVITARVATQDAPQRIELATVAQTIVDEQEAAEAAKAAEIAAAEARQKEEAEYIARVIYGMARCHATQHQETVVWCILNRVDDTRYPDDVIEVCRQEAQWVGYSDDNPVIESYYQMARRMLTEWRNGGHRPMAPDYVFAERTADSIILRSTYEITSRTRYYEA